jgi:dihydropteroate synthase
MLFRCQHHTFELKNRIVLMGILNVTPDSFSESGLNFNPGKAIESGLKMIEDGADIIDIGGESTRPGAAPVEADEEIRRVLPVIDGLRKHTDIPISIDTVKSEVAQPAVEHGANIINDISGFHRDNQMKHVARERKTGCVVMHMRGTPAMMQNQVCYVDMIGEIKDYFQETLLMLTENGIGLEAICLDPGIGFSKTAEQNLFLIKNLSEFLTLDQPLLLGPSRKSFIGKTLAIDDPQERMWGTAAAVSCGIVNGASVIRAHDVREMRQVCDLTKAIINAS